jgi:hypothetical protein
MLKNNPKVLAGLVAAGLAAFGIVQYLAISGLIPVSALARIHWIFLPAYSIGGAFGVMFQWFLFAGVWVLVLSEIAKRRRQSEPSDSDETSRPAPVEARPEVVVRRDASSFGRRGRA